MNQKDFEKKQKAELEEFLNKQKKDAEENRRIESMNEYNNFVNQCKAILRMYGFNDKQSDIIFEAVWQDKHGSGYSDVKAYIYDFCELYKDVNEAK